MTLSGTATNDVSISTIKANFGDSLAREILRARPDVVCFDYFDTLVTRTVYPESVKKIVCGRLEALIGVPEERRGELYTLRNRLEAETCHVNAANGFDLEFNLADLWPEIWNQAGLSEFLDQTSFSQLAMDLEISTECSVQELDPNMLRVLRELRHNGIRCWLVSDFYIPGDYFVDMLSHHELDSFFHQVTVSADSLLTKRSGRIYGELIAKNNWQPNQILMIGDNQHSDYFSARNSGLNAFHLDRTAQHDGYARLASAGTKAQDLIADAINQEEFVFKELSLTLYYFIERLHDSLILAGAKDVFFMAREGQFLKKLFDEYASSRKFGKSWQIRSHYIEVSRRSTLLPSLGPLDTEGFETLFRQYRRISVAEFLASLGLEDHASRLAAVLPFDVNAKVEDLPTSPEFEALKSNVVFRDAYEEGRLSRRNAFKAYFESFNEIDSNSDIHFVDVGWKGTIQDNLRQLFDGLGHPFNDRRIVGHYAGLVASGALSPRNVKTGLVFSNIEHVTRYFNVYDQNRALFEVALGANHGSAHSYRIGAGGKPWVKQSPFSEASLFYNKIFFFQKDLHRLFSTINAIGLKHRHTAEGFQRFVAQNHARMVFKPTSMESSWFENIYHVENFGVFEVSKFLGARKFKTPVDHAKFYMTLRRDPSKLDFGFWPWLACRQQGGLFSAWRFGTANLRALGLDTK